MVHRVTPLVSRFVKWIKSRFQRLRRLASAVSDDSYSEMDKMPRKWIKRLAESCGFAVFALLVAAIFGLRRLIGHWSDFGWADVLLFIPASFAFLAIEPVSNRVELRASHWWCKTHGGHTLVQHSTVRSAWTCARCDMTKVIRSPEQHQ